MEFRLERSERGGQSVVGVGGDLDVVTAPQLRDLHGGPGAARS